MSALHLGKNFYRWGQWGDRGKRKPGAFSLPAGQKWIQPQDGSAAESSHPALLPTMIAAWCCFILGISVRRSCGSLRRANAALAAPYRRFMRIHPHSCSEGGCNPIRLMARNITLTIPTTRLVKTAMAHLIIFWPASHPFIGVDGAAACLVTYWVNPRHWERRINCKL